jgi:hypothetical protein
VQALNARPVCCNLLRCVLRAGCPFKLRRCSSQGIAQGVLAVPSVLAALTAAASPAGAIVLGALSARDVR